MPPKPFRPAAAKTPAKIQTCYDVVVGFLKDDDWPFEADDENGTIATGYAGDNGKYELVIEAKNDMPMFAVHVDLPVEHPEAKEGQEDSGAFGELIEFVLKLNCGLAVGSFDLDLDDGSLRFRIGVLAGDAAPSLSLVRDQIYGAVTTGDRYFPLLRDVAAGKLTAEAALDKLGDEDGEDEDGEGNN